MYKAGFRFGLGMAYIEISIIAVLIALQTVLIIILHRGMVRAVAIGLKNLDSSIATAIQKVLSGDLPEIEQVNPVQALIMNFVQEKMKNSGPNLDIIRDENGRIK